MEDRLQNKCMYCMNGEYDEKTGICPVCHTPSSYANQDHQLMVGSVLAGRYIVGRALGQGGFGITYIGWDIVEGQKIAIKEYFPNGCATRKKDNYTLASYSDESSQNIYTSGKSRFLAEAECLEKMGNVPNVVRVRSSFCENDTAYIIMDYIEGITLKKYIADAGGTISLSDILEKLHPIVTALTTIHEKNLIHRDISPDNIILSPMGAVLLDFGAARPFSIGSDFTKTINVKNGYAPIEQYDIHGEQGPWTDVFAFASTVYRAITGILPASAIERSENADALRSPRSLCPSLTEEEERILLKGMAMEAGKRYHSIAEFYGELMIAHTTKGSVSVSYKGEKKPAEKKKSAEGSGKDITKVLSLTAAIACGGFAIYYLLYLIFLFTEDIMYLPLFAQQLAAIGGAGFLSFSFFKLWKGKQPNFNLLMLISDALFIVCLLSAVIFTLYSGRNIFGTMITYMHVISELIMCALAAVLSKKSGGKLFPDFKNIKK